MQAERQRWGTGSGRERESRTKNRSFSLPERGALNALGVKSILLYLTSTLGNLKHRCTHTHRSRHTHTLPGGVRMETVRLPLLHSYLEEYRRPCVCVCVVAQLMCFISAIGYMLHNIFCIHVQYA